MAGESIETPAEGEPQAKPVIWVASSKRNLQRFPRTVQGSFGFALWEVQCGHRPEQSKILKGFGGGAVLELVEDYVGGTYRAVYTVRFAGAVIVLHAFQRKSKRGIKTPHHEIDLVRRRLKLAEKQYEEWQLRRRQNQGGRGI